MNCEKISKLIIDLLAGEISEKDKLLLESHIADCESCRKEFGELKAVWTLTENSLKEDFFDGSLGADKHLRIVNSVKPDIQSVPSKKSTPIKFMWLEIAASIIVFIIFAAMLLPSLSFPKGNERQFTQSNKMKQEDSRTVTGNWHPITATKDVFVPQEEKQAVIAENEPSAPRGRAIAESVSRKKTAPEESNLRNGERQVAANIEKRAAGKGISHIESDREDKTEKSKLAYGNVIFAEGHVQGLGTAGGGPSRVEAGEKKNQKQKTAELNWEYKTADKNLADHYKHTEEAVSAKPAATPVPTVSIARSGPIATASSAAPALPVTTAPAKTAKPETAVMPLFARKALKDEDSKRDISVKDYRERSDLAAAEPVEVPVDTAKQSAYGQIDNLKAVKKELSSKTAAKAKEEKVSLVGRNYSLNLKLWDLTDEKTAREFLKRKGANFADSAKISINTDTNTITITTTKENLEKADQLFSELRKAEDSLKEMKNGIPFIPTKQKPFSTFSIDVDTASYTMARKLLRNGQKPDPLSVRPEEFINYFDYHYRSPSNSTFAVYLEAAPSVFRPENYTLRVGVKARELGPDGSRPSVFTILIDASGSMARENRMDLVKKSLPLLFDQMKPDDKVAVFSCTSHTTNIVNYLPVKEKKNIVELIEKITPADVADIEKGLVTAYDSALGHYVSGAYNRVILLTDGISNIGTHSAETILAKVSSARNMGITNTVIALGGDGDDKFLETIANKGDGNYVYIENEEGARELFINEFAGRFREIARDVKIQVEFNPLIVSQYRQIGYQNRQLSKADFRNDKVDAGEVGAGQSVTALYEMKLNKKLPYKNNDTSIDNPINYSICIVRLRYRRADNMDIEEKEFPLAYHELKFNFDNTSCGFRLAASVAEFAEFLRYPDVPGIANPGNIMKQIQGVIGEDYRNDGKVSELYRLMRNVK